MRGKNQRRSDVVPGADELLEAPPQDRFCLGFVDQFELGRSHCRLPLRLRLQGHSSASSARRSARLRSRVAAPKVWVPPTNVPRPREALPRTSGDSPVRVPRDPARAPHASARPPRFVDRVEQLVGVRSLVAADGSTASPHPGARARRSRSRPPRGRSEAGGRSGRCRRAPDPDSSSIRSPGGASRSSSRRDSRA